LVNLPAGDLPYFGDPAELGLGPDVTERAERCVSALSVTSAPVSALSVTLTDPVIEKLILESLPGGYGQRKRKLFLLARRIRGIPHLGGADPCDFRDVIMEWHRLALPFIRTKPFEDSWLDFRLGWDKVKWPAGSGPLDAILKEAAGETPPPGTE